MTAIEELLNPARPAAAYDDLLARVVPTARAQREHGSPPTASGRIDWTGGFGLIA